MDEGQRTLCRLPELTAATKAGGARKRSFAALPGRATAGAAAPGSEASGETSGLPPFAARVPPEPPCWERGAARSPMPGQLLQPTTHPPPPQTGPATRQG